LKRYVHEVKEKELKLIRNNMKYNILIEYLKNKIWSLLFDQLKEVIRSNINKYAKCIFKLKLLL